MNKLFLLAWLLAWNVSSYSQDIDFAKQQVRKLASRSFHGRGYVKKGDIAASRYLAGEYAHFHLKSFGNGYFQDYNFEVNTFPGKMEVKLGNKKLVPGIDYIVNPASNGCHGRFALEDVDSAFLHAHADPVSLEQLNFTGRFVLLDTSGFTSMHKGLVERELFSKMGKQARGIILITDADLIFSVSTVQMQNCFLLVKRSCLKSPVTTLQVDIQSKLVNHEARNLIGYLPGEVDTFIVLTAHYDHLGQMGRKAYFPGANDNASGTAMVLDLIRGFTSTAIKHKYSYAFILFSGEEAGLLGSRYYVSNPLFPLGKIKMVVNFDMVGTGSGGVTVFSGSAYPREFQKLDSLDKADSLHLTLRAKGVRPNSDHYPFYEQKVPALFFLTEEKGRPYHSVNDKFETLPFTDYQNLYKLIAAYLKTF